MINKINYKSVIALIFLMGITVITTSCGKEKKLKYGDNEGVVSGSIQIKDDNAEFDLDNVIAAARSDIDYTSAITTDGETDDYTLEVNASNVKYDTPGTYTANYTVKSGDKTYTESIKVTITDDKINSNENDNSQAQNIPEGTASVENQGGIVSGGSQGTTVGNQETSGAANQETSKTLITNGNTPYNNAVIPNASIELLSGDVVTISCSTNKYIVSTRTDESQVTRNGHNYKVTKLVVIFNTGAEQTLETVEKKID